MAISPTDILENYQYTYVGKSLDKMDLSMLFNNAYMNYLMMQRFRNNNDEHAMNWHLIIQSNIIFMLDGCYEYKTWLDIYGKIMGIF